MQKKEDPDFLMQHEVFAAHAEHGRLDKTMVKKGMGRNWPKEWDTAHPDIFEPEKR